MFRNDFFIYVGKGTINKEDQITRKAKTIAFIKEKLGSDFGTVIKEGSVRRFGELKANLSVIFSKRRIKPTLVIRTWREIRDQEVIDLLVEHSFSVIITDEIEDIDTSEIKLVGKRSEYIEFGPVLGHIIDVQARMRSYLTGKAKSPDNAANRRSGELSMMEAHRLWREIEKVAETHKLTKQKDIANQLIINGVTTPEGAAITQRYISKIAGRVGQGEKWVELKHKVERQMKLDL
ncbi:MAG: hypothetical protein HOC33_11110 [Alphaproteobacteria bacterium]|jgi:hypothetical protein|nr:hypothetical protein [Alphaproteobacteria bacterium]MBT4082866.1 hypothetical protein [Alphaproteobacteria bacterium]MBT4544387.1 hypothetical protein [Alphaproteobacteria bacterium]MBT4889381.1 hypothetical protein [Rhodospirillales bacterium]